MRPNTDDYPLASIVVPMHNAGKKINDCLDSLVAQTYKPLEIIVVDDGSTDDSCCRVRVFADRGEVTLLTQDRSGGPSSPRNNGLRQATGDVIFFFDADDIALPDKVEVTMAAIAAAPPGTVMAATDFCVFHDEDRTVTSEGFLRQFSTLMKVVGTADTAFIRSEIFYDLLLFGNFIGTSSVAIKRSTFTHVGRFDESLRNADDFDLWTRVARHGDLVLIMTPLHHYRLSAGGISKRSNIQVCPDRIKVMHRQIQYCENSQQSRRVRKRIALHFCSMGWDFRVRRQYNKAVHHYWQSLIAYPNLSAARGLIFSSVLQLFRFTNIFYPEGTNSIKRRDRS